MKITAEPEMPFVSLVVHNYKGTAELRTCLASLHQIDYPKYEIILADCLTIGIHDWIKRNFPNVKVIYFDEDNGVPSRLNVAFAHCNPRAKYIAYLHEDMYFEKNWLTQIIKAMEENQKIGCAQPFLIKTNNKNQIDCREVLMDFLGYSYLPYKDCEIKKLPHGLIQSSYIGLGVYRVDALTKTVFNNKFFDDDYFIHWFDIDLSWRILLANYKIVVVLDSIIYHNRGISKGRCTLPPRNIFINNRNWIMTLIKNYNLKNLMLYCPPLIFLKVAEVCALLPRDAMHALATLQGLIDPLRNFRVLWKKRLLIQKNVRSISDSVIKENFVKLNPSLLYRSITKHYS